MQVTRLLCGGFIVGGRMNHTMTDGTGVCQFMTAVAEIARNAASVPSVKPVWNRELLMARNPPRVTCVPHVYDEYHHNYGFPDADMVYLEDTIDLSFFFSLPEIASLKNLLPPHLRTCSKFEILATCIWRCRTIALNFNSSDIVRFVCVVNARTKVNPPLPVGYYGNTFGLQVALTTVGELRHNPLGYALELVKKAKAEVTDELMKSTADFLVINGRPNYVNIRTYEVSDIRHIGFKDIDYGWGKPLYGGPIAADIGLCFFQSSTNNKGEDGILAMVSLPRLSTERFTVEIEKMIREANGVNFSCFPALLRL
ncbi:Benzyl alcohol o-benzoyltransferase [Thalictrum thalictroides]|uniref:Benzyl alcohol o-benzoyltransferase n=1 Tax=Thalictrum thalictroides TaxID=46969 RepID=A0A7J6VNL8_THATH|nr:Benzyl alcohol o-benzoyltransferase [Thalictrum thalictroides]